MRDFKSGNRSRDRRSFGDRDSRRPSLHDAVCDECGKDCQVPFRPSGDKPIYCSDCFESKGGGDSNRSRDRRSFGDRDSRRPSLHDAVCDECGKDCQVPFRPSGDKPIYCSDCFESKGGGSRSRDRRGSSRRSFGDRGSRKSSQGNIDSRSISQLGEKVEALNTKLNTIINLLSPVEMKKSKLVKKKTKKNKKSTNKKENKATKVLTPVKKKDTKEKKLKKK
ncbi:CxxC-x17-CxxC domain-containing protein [Patescibacteria group bacterium]